MQSEFSHSYWLSVGALLLKVGGIFKEIRVTQTDRQHVNLASWSHLASKGPSDDYMANRNKI